MDKKGKKAFRVEHRTTEVLNIDSRCGQKLWRKCTTKRKSMEKNLSIEQKLLSRSVLRKAEGRLKSSDDEAMSGHLLPPRLLGTLSRSFTQPCQAILHPY